MQADCYLPEDPEYTICDSARDSVRFAHYCLIPGDCGRWSANSTFVDPDGKPQLWHDFGALEGPGWAANAIGGAQLLYSWALHDRNRVLKHVALGLLDHVLHDGFLLDNGFIRGYRNVQTGEFCLNFKHTNDWMCPGAMAKAALQMLWMSDLLPDTDPHVKVLRDYAPLTAKWLATHVQRTQGWYPRRVTADGAPYPLSAEGGDDPLANSSGDGLYIVWLMLELTERGLGGYAATVREVLDEIVQRGGIYGSINHDTYDSDENVTRAETFRLFRRAARYYGDPALKTFAYDNALAGLERFQMADDRNGVVTRGLLYMEDSWDTAYLWENAEVALAYLEAYEETHVQEYCCTGVTILRAIARHHHGSHGFLTEGVDWNNHVGQQHHIAQAPYGDIAYTQPLLNNLHHIEPVLLYRRLTEASWVL